MKICLITSMFPPYTRGGAETAAYNVACIFVKAGHEVCVVSCAPFSGRASFAGKWEQANSLRIFRFTPLNLFTVFNIAKYPAFLRLLWHLLDMFNLHTYLVVRRILREEKPDLILTHNLKGLGYTVPLAIRYWLAVSGSCKWFHTLHDLALVHPTGLKIYGQEKNILQNNLLVSLYAWINKKLFGSPPIVISPSQFLLDEYNTRDFFAKSKKVVIRNPVNSFVSTPSVSQSFSFLYVGQLEPYKGLNLLLEAWKEFSGMHRDAELIIAGTGSMQEEVERAAKSLSRLQYVGFVAHDKLDALFSKVHAMILPSLAYENSPTSIGEAFAYGLPVIASHIGGIPELVQDGVNGVLFEPGNFEALVLAMEKVTKEWKSLCAGAQKSVENFSPARYREQMDALIKNL